MSLTSKIRDIWGRIVKPTSSPEKREIASVQIRDRWSVYPSVNLTPARLSGIFRMADAGYPREQAELFEEMEEKDAHLSTLLQTRKLAVAALDWEVQPFSDSDEDKKISKFVDECLSNIDDLGQDIQDILDAVGKGYSVTEIIWDTEGKKAFPIDLCWVHPKKVVFINSIDPRILTDEDLVQGIEPPPWKIIYHRHRARSGFDQRAGSLRVVAYLYLLKSWAWKDWATFNEVFGMPVRLGKYDPAATPAEKESLLNALRQLGTDAAGIISENTNIEFVEASSRGAGRLLPFSTMISQCNREMSKAVLGQTLTTDTEGSTGTYSTAKVHAGVKQDILEADAVAIQNTIRAQLIKPIVGFNFGWDKPLPWFKMHFEEGEDLVSLSTVYKNLAEMGQPFTQEHLAERFGVNLPEEGQHLVGVGAAGREIDADGNPIPQPGQEGQIGADGKPIPPAKGEKPGGDQGNLPNLGAAGPLSLKAGLSHLDSIAISNQRKLDQIVDEALLAGGDFMADALSPVRDLIAKASSLEEIKDKLLTVYPDIDHRGLGQLLYQARMLAWMKGRLGDGK